MKTQCMSCISLSPRVARYAMGYKLPMAFPCWCTMSGCSWVTNCLQTPSILRPIKQLGVFRMSSKLSDLPGAGLGKGEFHGEIHRLYRRSTFRCKRMM